MNKYIKEVGEIAGINDVFMEDEFACKKFKNISNHTARRTFTTLAYLYLDLDIGDLMRFFDHRKNQYSKDMHKSRNQLTQVRLLIYLAITQFLKK